MDNEQNARLSDQTLDLLVKNSLPQNAGGPTDPDCLPLPELMQFAQKPDSLRRESLDHIRQCAGCRHKVSVIHQNDLFVDIPPIEPHEIQSLIDSIGPSSDEPVLLIDQLGAILGCISDNLPEIIHNRRALFRDAVIQGIEKVGDSSQVNDFAEQLLLQAHKHRWQRWAVESLPSLLVIQPDRALVWEPIVASVPQYLNVTVEAELCDGLILVLGDLESPTANYLQSEGAFFEFERNRNQTAPSDRSMEGALIQINLALIEEAKENGDEERAQFLRESNDRRVADRRLALNQLQAA